MFSGRLRISVAEESRRKTGAARVLAAAKAFLPTIPPQLIVTEPTEEREGGRGYLDGDFKHKNKNEKIAIHSYFFISPADQDGADGGGGGSGYLDGNSKHKHKYDDDDETSKRKLKR